jgi:hypothetical protein
VLFIHVSLLFSLCFCSLSCTVQQFVISCNHKFWRDVQYNSLHVSRYGSNGDAVDAPDVPSPASISMSRRPSFRAIVPPTLYDAESSDQPGKWRHVCL